MNRTPWNPTTHADYQQLKGNEVVTTDGESVGTIAAIFHPRAEMPAARGHHYFLVKPGIIKDWFAGFDQVYLPEASLAHMGQDQVVVNLTAEQMKQRSQEWHQPPLNLDTFHRG